MENEPDYMKRWRKAKSKIMKGYDEFHALILLSRTSGADYEFLLNKDPLFIARNFISKMIQS